MSSGMFAVNKLMDVIINKSSSLLCLGYKSKRY